jgi:hypothetical protein
MSDYYHDIFYKVHELDFETKKKIIHWAFKRKKNWSVDKLDCNESRSRQSVELSIDGIMSKFNNAAHFVVIHRRGYEDWKNSEIFDNKWCLEVGFRTMESPDYFLWIWCDENFVDEIVKEFDLKILG